MGAAGRVARLPTITVVPAQQPITSVSDPRWLRAVSHPVRIRLLAMLDEEPASPVMLAAKLGQPLGTIAYHVRTLYDLGLLKLVSTRQRRGATEHYYRATAHPAATPEAWEALDPVSKQRLLTALIATANDYATRSAAAGGFDGSDAHISTHPLKLDREGLEELGAEARRWVSSAQAIERRAAERIARSTGPAIDVGLNLMVFRARPFSAQVAGGGERNDSDEH